MAYFAFSLGHHGGMVTFERSRVFAEDTDEAVEIALS
ncbi:hypothetical protein MMMDOFMJ_4722 [Methylobacterium gnaphalii]|nr:hypothetical protein MMMDOFMJ_4722 [Methylobacterium gnaphalii]